jgi:hypothetical protein
LERFLAVSLANTDEEYYWLHKMWFSLIVASLSKIP